MRFSAATRSSARCSTSCNRSKEREQRAREEAERERKQREWLEQKERARREEAERKKQEWLERRQLREAAREQADRAARERAERNRVDRQERFLLRDPFHIYALAGGADGRSAKDWTLILDDHKGAHTLELSLPSSAKAAGIGVSERPLQRLRITEHSKVFEFELCAHPRACAPLAACPSFQASCARASEAEARGGTGAPLPLGKFIGRPRRGKGVAPPPPSLGSRWAWGGLSGGDRGEIEGSLGRTDVSSERHADQRYACLGVS